MKKNLLTLALATFATVNLFSQTIPNGSFENWTAVNYDECQNYAVMNSNFRSLKSIGQITMTKIADPFHGSFAVKIQTKTNGVDTMSGFILNGMPGGTNPIGGIPYTQQPSGFSGHYKCSVPAGDTALVAVQFKKNGLSLGNMNLKKFTGTQNSYASFNIPISLGSPPDSVIIAAVSSNANANNFKGIPGSFLQLDSINFRGVVSQPANMNGSFELWNVKTLNVLNNWSSQGDSIINSNVPYVGASALLLQVSNQPCGGGPCYNVDRVTTGYFTSGGSIKGGKPFTLQNDSLIGYYKCLPNGNDSAYISFKASISGANLTYYKRTFTSSASYKRFSIPINLGTAPDSLRIDISAANGPMNAGMLGSKLWVDGVQLLSQPLAVPLLFMGEQYLNAYPNPNNGIFNLVYDTEYNEPVNLEVLNVTGHVVLTEPLDNKGAKNKIDLSVYGSGIYLLKTTQNGKVCTRRIIIQ